MMIDSLRMPARNVAPGTLSSCLQLTIPIGIGPAISTATVTRRPSGPSRSSLPPERFLQHAAVDAADLHVRNLRERRGNVRGCGGAGVPARLDTGAKEQDRHALHKGREALEAALEQLTQIESRPLN